MPTVLHSQDIAVASWDRMRTVTLGMTSSLCMVRSGTVCLSVTWVHGLSTSGKPRVNLTNDHRLTRYITHHRYWSGSGICCRFCFGFSCGVLLPVPPPGPLPLPLVSAGVAGGGADQCVTSPGLQWRNTWFSLWVINHSIKPWSSLHHFAR